MVWSGSKSGSGSSFIIRASLALTIWVVLLSSHCVRAQVEHYWKVFLERGAIRYVYIRRDYFRNFNTNFVNFLCLLEDMHACESSRNSWPWTNRGRASCSTETRLTRDWVISDAFFSRWRNSQIWRIRRVYNFQISHIFSRHGIGNTMLPTGESCRHNASETLSSTCSCVTTFWV